MRENQWTCLRTQHLLLKPYLKSFIPTYHTWMQDPWLLEMTATEPMSHEEEATAQQEWIDDPKKLTFIVFDRAQAEGAPPGSSQGMCGDANLFVLDDGGEGGGSTAEVMVMIGDPAYRRRGYAREAVLALMAYAARTPPLLRSQPDGGGVDTFVAKISSDNAASLALFTGKLGYTVHKVVPAFGETHVRRSVRGGGGGGGGVGGGPRHDTHVGGVPALQPLPSESAAFTAEVAGIELVALPFDNPELEQTEAHAGRGATQQC